ncbi:MAG TPA: cbb3-type cytochrome c oxidase subunit I [Myxococcales bacterium]|jgi:cytochrome c oxidase subunit 1
MSEPQAASYLDEGDGVASWLSTLDHKRIAVMYLASVLVVFALGGTLAGLVRLKMLWPGEALIDADTWMRLLTLHGVVMGFAFVVPAIPAVLGNFLVPLMVGAKGFAYPRLNRASLYVYWAGALVALSSFASGGLDTGWTLAPPRSTTAEGPVPAVALGVFVMGFSGVLTGLNFLGTIHRMRAPGLSWRKLPLLLWALYATSLLQIVATPALGSAMLVLVADRLFGLGQFDVARGGSPLVYQQLFWFYAHNAVYLALLPGVGVVSEVIAVHARRSFGYGPIVVATFATAGLGLVAWGQHMVVAGQSPNASAVFSALALLAIVPTVVLVLSWLATLWRGSIALSVPMLYALGFVALFTVAGLSGLFLAMLAQGVHLSSTYFEVAHLHYLVVGGTAMAFLAGLHHWWPKITGRTTSEALGRLAWALVMLGVNATFFVQFVLGSRGMPRRHYAYEEGFRLLQGFSTVGTWILGLGLLVTLAVFVQSLRSGRKAVANPWGGASLEWRAPSPPVAANFVQPPVVTHGPYDFAAALAPAPGAGDAKAA